MSSEIASRSSRVCDQETTENQRIHLRAQETIEGFFRPADNWFVVVERSIQHHRHSREIAKRRNQRVVPRIRLARDRLQAARPINMSRSRNLVAFFAANGVRKRHERRRMRLLEILCSRFRQDRRREWPEDYSVLDAAVEDLLHFLTPRISNNTSIAKRARAPFAPALKPAEDFSIGDQGRGLAHQFLFRQ